MTKRVMAIARCIVGHPGTLTEPGTVFQVPDDFKLGSAHELLPDDPEEQQALLTKALHVPQRPEIALAAKAKMARAVQMREQGFGDTIVPHNLLPSQHQEVQEEPSPVPKPRAKTPAKAK